MEAIKERVSSYWTGRSEEFARLKGMELSGSMAELWLEQIRPRLPKGRLRILDVGTGCGFFSILLAKQGHMLTGIDLTPAMIEQAGRLAEENGAVADFRVMDAENLSFADNSFDAVISRNLTWTLPHPERAYSEWLRVLKPGGVLLNFDADYGEETFANVEMLPKNHAHKKLSFSQLRECDAIKAQLSISASRRPVWDRQVLDTLGCRQIQVDPNVSRNIYRVKDEQYNPTPLFLIRAVK